MMYIFNKTEKKRTKKVSTLFRGNVQVADFCLNQSEYNENLFFTSSCVITYWILNLSARFAVCNTLDVGFNKDLKVVGFILVDLLLFRLWDTSSESELESESKEAVVCWDWFKRKDSKNWGVKLKVTKTVVASLMTHSFMPDDLVIWNVTSLPTLFMHAMAEERTFKLSPFKVWKLVKKD